MWSRFCGSGSDNLRSCPHMRVKQDFAGSMFQFERILKSLSVVVMQQRGPQLSFCVWAGEQSSSLIAANRGYHQSVWMHRGPSVSVMEQQGWNRIHVQFVNAYFCSVIYDETWRDASVPSLYISVSFTNWGWGHLFSLYTLATPFSLTLRKTLAVQKRCTIFFWFLKAYRFLFWHKLTASWRGEGETVRKKTGS